MEAATTNIPKKTLLELYRNLLTARRLADKMHDLAAIEKEGMFSVHPGRGEEAISLAIMANLRKDDYLLIRTRVMLTLFAKGLSFRDIIACEMYRDVPKAGGHGTYYYIHPEYGNLGRSHTLGEDIPIYLGAALSAQMRHTDQVSIIMVGDGAASRGPVHEAMVVASAWGLPAVFVLQNNQYAMGTSSRRETYKNLKDFSDRGRGYGIPSYAVDGNDILAMYDLVKKCIAKARRGGGPSFIAAETYRLGPHMEGDPQVYRPKGEIEKWWKKDPLPRYQKQLMKMGILTTKDVNKLEAEIKAELDAAAKAAMKIPRIKYEDYVKDAVVDVL
ncbi:MAG: thiamine pyrophosphate-dependent dehydrogenase E1 component subunit alpha [Chloroflexota bacterium]